jgi:hypothetical protein
MHQAPNFSVKQLPQRWRSSWLKHHLIDVSIYAAILVLGGTGVMLLSFVPKLIFQSHVVYAGF